MPTYNTLLIDFTNDWVSGDTLKFNTYLGASTYQGGVWTWNSARTTTFEVAEGIPTANAGERAAINFKAAFDLDYPTGYVTVVQNTNEVLISSETIGETFNNGATGVSNTGTAVLTPDNGVSPLPVADFSGTPTSGDNPLSVDFTDSTTNIPTSWAWTFGDGGTSTEQNPTHIYASAGTYDVGLTATNDTGSDLETKVGYITVSEAPDPTPQNIQSLLVRSPFYIYTPFNYSTSNGITISLKVWSGDLNLPPATATETLTKIRPSIDFSEFNTDLAKTIRDQFDITPVLDISSTTQIIESDTDSIKWASWEAVYDDTVETIPDITGSGVALDGYGYMQEGVNPTPPSNGILSDVTFRRVERNGFILLPFINNGDITSFDIDSDLGTINATETPTVTYDNSSWVSYLCVDVSAATTDDNIVITANPSAETFTYQILDECRYTPNYVVFKNKYGVFENLTMFKKRVDSLKTERKEFINNYISGGTYDITRHQIKDINVTGNESVVLNSGYVTESENELYKQMLLSDDVYFYENSSFVPVRVTSSNLEYKTRVNDTVINYTINFDYAFNTINNI